MRYLKVVAEGDDWFHSTYIVTCHNLISNNEVEKYVSTCGLGDLVNDNRFDEDPDEGFQLDTSEISEEDFEQYIFDYRHVRERCRVEIVGFPQDTVLVVYRVWHRDISEEPQAISCSASAGQSFAIDSFGYIDNNHPREKVYDELRQDCLYQLKRYGDACDTMVVSGILSFEEITGEDYQEEVEARELVLA